MIGIAACSSNHQWRVSREAGRFVLGRPHLALQARGPSERTFQPSLCPTCGKPALRVVESRLRS